MRRLVLLLIAVIAFAAVIVPLTYYFTFQGPAEQESNFYFGVTYGEDTVEGAKLLIDRVQNCTNLFVVDSFNISQNETQLNQICSYASQKGLNFFVYFFSLYVAEWQRSWVETANQTCGNKFLGVYLRDEPGGRQIDLNETVSATVAKAANYTYTDVAQNFVSIVGNTWSMSFLKNHSIPVVASDYALYWFDYEAGFNTIFAELGSNSSTPLQIAQCRGAAVSQGKEWGTIITWTYDQPPYIEEASKMYQDMVTSYDAGAKYVLVFDYPQSPEGNPYGILTDEHFAAMQQFWNYTQTHPQNQLRGEVAFVLPKDYGWGLRNGNDTVWGLWDPYDSSLPYSLLQIGHDIYVLLERHGTNLDVVYEQNGVNPADTYSTVYLWNTTDLGTPPPPITP
jgi:hypothetical protein